MNDPYGNNEFSLSKSFATDIYVACADRSEVMKWWMK